MKSSVSRDNTALLSKLNVLLSQNEYQWEVFSKYYFKLIDEIQLSNQALFVS